MRLHTVIRTCSGLLAAHPEPQPSDVANLLAADKSGNLFIVYSSPKTQSITNIHIAKTDPAGNLLASFDFGGTGLDYPNAATTDPQGNLIIVGRTYSPDFPMVFPLIKTGNSFATKIDAIYIAGTTNAGFATTTGVLQPQAPSSDEKAGGFEHGFVMELSPAGDRVVYSTYFSGATFICASVSNPCTLFQPPFNISPVLVVTTPSAIAVDATGAVTIAGTTNSTGLPISAGAYGT